ncbi:MAG: TIM barrel protein [Nitrospiraceae bacterium]|nr:TIM barrel protein [Nitrospiraceae bacterium]
MQPTRRQLLKAGIALAATAATGVGHAAVVPTTLSSGEGTIAAQFGLSLAAYSFRQYLPSGGKPGKMTLHDLFELAAMWRLDAIEPTSYYFSSEDKAYLHSLKAKAFKLGLDISGTAIRNNFCLPPGQARDREIAHVKKWVDHAAEFGAPSIRIFAGSKPRNNVPREQQLAWMAECAKECCDYAGTRGVFLGLENHGHLTETAEAVLKIVEAVDHEWFGVNLDTGNFHTQPYENIAQLAPKAITVQVKVQVAKADGGGREPADFARIVGILRDANYRGYLALEYEAEEDPMTAVPRYLDQLRQATSEEIASRAVL